MICRGGVSPPENKRISAHKKTTGRGGACSSQKISGYRKQTREGKQTLLRFVANLLRKNCPSPTRHKKRILKTNFQSKIFPVS